MISMGPGGFRIMGASLSCYTMSQVLDYVGTFCMYQDEIVRGF